MVARVAHAMAPHRPALLDHELAAHLPEIAAGERFAARAEGLDEGAERGRGDAKLHVFGRFGAEVEGAGHAEGGVEALGGVGVDGEGAGGGARVHGDEVGLAAAYDGDFDGVGEGEEGGGGEDGREGAEVFLAVLGDGGQYGECCMVGRMEGAPHTPQKKCRMKIMRTLCLSL